MNSIRLIIADMHKLVRESWSSMLSNDGRFRITAASPNAAELIESAIKLRPDIILLDTNMGSPAISDTIKKLRQFSPLSRLIGISVHAQPAYVKQIMLAGAQGYLTKNSSKSELMEAIIEVYHGNKFICTEVKDIASRSLLGNESSPDIHSLTQRELEVVEQIRKGFSSKEIASALAISLKTVQVHRHNILKKLKLRNTASLVNFINISQS
jgi:two-component system invasion response regulator UvrY